MNDVVQIGKIVRQLRVQRSLSQTELANRIGWQQPAVCAFEKGRREALDISDLKSLANALRVSPARLLYGSAETYTLKGENEISSFVLGVTDQIARLNSRQQEKVWNIVAELVSVLE